MQQNPISSRSTSEFSLDYRNRNTYEGGLSISQAASYSSFVLFRSIHLVLVFSQEEQTTGTSMNYDVELFHHKAGHSELERIGT